MQAQEITISQYFPAISFPDDGVVFGNHHSPFKDSLNIIKLVDSIV